MGDSDKSTAVASIAAGNSHFGFDLLEAITSPAKTDNLIISPLSLSIAMAMLDAGAGEKTSKEIRTAFRFPSDEDQLHQGYRQMLKQVAFVPAEDMGEEVALSMPCKLFVADRFTLNPSFSQTLVANYAADAERIDYTKPAEAAVVINQFVATSTKDKIKDIVTHESLNADTILVLVNAIHFKAPWSKKFKRSVTTSRKPFFTSLTKAIPVDMMTKDRLHVMYGEHPKLDAKSISMDYEGLRHHGQVSMLILLPKEKDGLTKLEASLKTVSLDQVLSEQSDELVDLQLPKFKIESTINFEEPINTLGCGSIFKFGPESDFSKIGSGSGSDFRVSKIIQKAFLDVNENGSEAAAATAIDGKRRRKSGFQRKILPFVVNRPFLAVIIMEVSDSETFDLKTSSTTPLLIARIRKPTQ